MGFMDTSYFHGKFALLSLYSTVQRTEWVFRLHYIWTSWLLIFFTLMLSYKEWVGSHIECTPIQEDTSNDPVIPKKVVHTYCYVTSTFTVPYDSRLTSLAGSVAGPDMSYRYFGGPPYIDGKSEKIMHAYYQWVSYFLFLLAIMFQATFLLWTNYESSKLDHFVQPLNERSLKHEKEEDRLVKLARYLIESRGEHFWFSAVYILCEFGNLIVTGLAMWLTDVFLQGEFSQYGYQVFDFLAQDPELRSDPMARVFPRITKCLFRKIGPSGNIERFDTTCVLAANVVNEKIFAFLWLWYIIIAAFTAAQLVHRIMTLLSASFRRKNLGLDSYTNSQLAVVVDRITTTDWIMLRLIRLNLPSIRFQRLITKMYDVLVENSYTNANPVAVAQTG